MYIANPIYDTVFKYLLEDNALAKLLIGGILQEEILSLEFRPQEHTSTIDRPGQRVLTVYRMDFAARLRNPAGDERQVLIELQKAKLPTDIIRFRRYLGAQYADPENTRSVPLKAGTENAKSVRQGVPLLTIDFLGHALEHTDAPDVIQIPKLRGRRRTEVEELLQVFDQGRIHGDRHRLLIDEAEVPERYRPILRRLQRAAAEPQIAEAMDVEDEVLEELQSLERELEQERAGREQAEQRAEQEQQRAEQEQQRAEQERVAKEQAEQRAGQEAERAARLAERLRALGIDPD